jgi:hypothetical protein
LEDVVLRALEKKPEQRFPTMSALAAEVQRVTSFGPDGSLRVASASGVVSRPVFAMANQLELPSREEVAVSTRTTTRRRRGQARARAWLIYAGVALGVAALAITAQRLLSARAIDLANSAVPPPPPAPPTAAIAPALQSSADSPPASPSVAPTTALPAAASAAATPSPTARSASRSRPAASAAPKKPADSMSTDFADPWSRPK